MSSSCRILPFPQRIAERQWSLADAQRVAAGYLNGPAAHCSSEILDPDVLMALCGALTKRVNVEPSLVLDESTELFETVLNSEEKIGVFDEREFVLGELALLAGKTSRLLGKRVDSEQWLDRADSFFRQTVNPAPHLSNVAYGRLALRHEVGDFNHVLEYTLPLSRTFERLSMYVEAAKTLYLRVAALKLVGRWDEAYGLAQTLTASSVVQDEPGLLAQVWIEIGEHHAHCENYAASGEAYQEALPLLERENRPIAVFGLKLSIGETLRSQTRLEEALGFFRSACSDAQEMGLTSNLAYARLLTSETLLALGRHREAEWEVRAALPTIQEESMVPEGLAALNLLRESVSRRKADPAAVKTLRTFLQPR